MRYNVASICRVLKANTKLTYEELNSKKKIKAEGRMYYGFDH